jgi:hypothetical protein
MPRLVPSASAGNPRYCSACLWGIPNHRSTHGGIEAPKLRNKTILRPASQKCNHLKSYPGTHPGSTKRFSPKVHPNYRPGQPSPEKPLGHLPSPEDGPQPLTASHWPPEWSPWSLRSYRTLLGRGKSLYLGNSASLHPVNFPGSKHPSVKHSGQRLDLEHLLHMQSPYQTQIPIFPQKRPSLPEKPTKNRNRRPPSSVFRKSSTPSSPRDPTSRITWR